MSKTIFHEIFIFLLFVREGGLLRVLVSGFRRATRTTAISRGGASSATILRHCTVSLNRCERTKGSGPGLCSSLKLTPLQSPLSLPPLLVFFLQRARLCTVRQKEEVRSAWMRVQASQQRRKVQDLRQSCRSCRRSCTTVIIRLLGYHQCQKVQNECCVRLGETSRQKAEVVRCLHTANCSNCSTANRTKRYSRAAAARIHLGEARWMLPGGQ